MRRILTRSAAAVLLALAAGGPTRSAGQERPSEDELFGTPPVPPARPAPGAPDAPPGPEAPGQGGASARDGAILGGSRAGEPPAAAAAQGATGTLRSAEIPLAIGGVAYLRATTTATRGTAPADWALVSPNLLDVYADARPNERVRAFALGRLRYQPTQGESSFRAPQVGDPSGGGTTAFSGIGSQGGTTAVLDQLWLNFDVRRSVFVTAGKQHVKWGVGRFWNPTDYLHPVRRDPLALYDTRSGVTLVKAHVPWEARGWNFYGVGLVEDATGEGAISTLGRIGAGGRAELVLGTAELGLDALVQRGNRPRFGVDLSAGIWDLDLYAEAALRTGTDVARFVPRADASPDAPAFTRFLPARATGFTPQVTLGGSWSFRVSDEDTLNLGAEYFFNDAGYSDPHAYAALLVAQVFPAFYGVPAGGYFNPFYLGRHYAGVFANLPRPGAWNDWDLTASVLGNLSDRSFIARLDVGVVVNTYLRLEVFAAGHAGPEGGEFRLASPAQTVDVGGAPVMIPAVRAPILDAGVALRVNL
jgi:hypothetical protein